MARRRVISQARRRYSPGPHKPVPHEPPEQPKMSPLEEKLCASEDWRNAFLMPIFAVGMSKGSGAYVKPVNQCRGGMAQIVKFTCDNKIHCGEPDIEDAAAELAIQIGSLIYDDDTVAAAFQAMKSWILEYCEGKGHPKHEAEPPPKQQGIFTKAKGW